MNEDFVSFELAKKLKENGYNKPFYFYYRTDDECIHHVNTVSPLIYSDKIDDEVIIAPTISQVLKWLRERNIILAINPSYFKGDCCFGWDCDIWENANYNHRCVSDNSYEEAALAGIEFVIDNLI